MSDKLTEICETKREEVDERMAVATIADLDRHSAHQDAPRGFEAALRRKAETGFALIAEIKKASPSKGLIRRDFRPAEHAVDYERGGAACLSVLTDGPSFGGSLEDFARIRSAVGLPMLRKDFMIDPYQVIESRVHGADCVLVIMACLSDAQASELTDTALDLGMDVLLETHNEEELARALRLPSPLIGINNRDLKRMVTDLATTERLAPLVPDDKVLISESGVSSPENIERLRKTGARRFLIGESLMKMGINRHKSVTQMRVAGTN